LGRFIKLKGFAHLIDAVAQLGQEPVPYLMLGGQGPLREQLENRAQKAGIAERVKFLGYIPNKYTPIYYSAADVFVLPSIIDKQGNTEGLGVVLLEAIACETPCVASSVGGITDIIVDGVNGFLVEPGNSQQIANRLSQIITGENIRERMGKQGRLMVEKRFSWQAQADEILKVYKYLIR
jgi:glycosyltransferase involved in cell wall biosynthesis